MTESGPTPGRVADKGDVIRWNRNIQYAINFIMFALPIIFTYLSFRNMPISDVLRSLSTASAGDILWKLILTIYFFLWVFGCKSDANDQELIYAFAPRRGTITRSSIAVIAAICVLAAFLLWSRNYEEFIVALAVFFVFNIFAWRFLLKQVAPAIRASRELCERKADRFGKEQLLVIEEYLFGNWQWLRFALGAVVIITMGAIAVLARTEPPFWTMPDLMSWILLQDLGMATFVVAMEVWIWLRRLKLKTSLALLEELKDRYRLEPN